MLYVRYGGRKGRRLGLRVATDLVVVRTKEAGLAQTRVQSKAGRAALEGAQSILQFENAGVDVLRLPGSKARRDKARAALKRDKGLRFAGSVLTDTKSREPVIYTENFFVKFDDALTGKRARALMRKYGLTGKRDLDYAGHAYFAAAGDGTGRKIFAIAEALLQEEGVELCHPEMIRRSVARAAHRNQWHLKKTTHANGAVVNAHADVEKAWALSEGDGTIVAIVDDGVDVDHEEFAGGWKIVSPRDVTRGSNNARPYYGNDDHGTACAGVAVANGAHDAAGVAPKARLMPIRLRSNLGSQAEADAFVWAADKGADVISCSWGPPDGHPTNPNDPVHNQYVGLPDSTRLAIDYAAQHGRGGKGCGHHLGSRQRQRVSRERRLRELRQGHRRRGVQRPRQAERLQRQGAVHLVCLPEQRVLVQQSAHARHLDHRPLRQPRLRPDRLRRRLRRDVECLPRRCGSRRPRACTQSRPALGRGEGDPQELL